MLELLSRLVLGHSRGPGHDVVELNDSVLSINATLLEKAISRDGLAGSIEFVLSTIRGKQGIFLPEQASDITKALFPFLETAVYELSIEYEHSEAFMSKYQDWCEACT